MVDDKISIDSDAVCWVAVLDGEIVHEAETEEDVILWATEEGLEPDRIVSKLPLDPPIRI